MRGTFLTWSTYSGCVYAAPPIGMAAIAAATAAMRGLEADIGAQGCAVARRVSNYFCWIWLAAVDWAKTLPKETAMVSMLSSFVPRRIIKSPERPQDVPHELRTDQ